ncbi:MAG: YcxB family protein [Lachnospiraceae bacterium]|nr:YcxB family protein [Lachnospiraceae bacterium]
MKSDSVNPDLIPILENKFIFTKSMNRQYARVTYGRYHSKWQKITFIIALVLFALGFGFVFLRLIIPFVILILVGLYVFFMSWFGYLYQAMVNYSQLTQYFGSPVEMHIIFYSKFFRVVGPKNNFDFLYSQITDIIELEDMTILTVSGKGIITHGQVIDKKAFTKDELRKFYNLICKGAK